MRRLEAVGGFVRGFADDFNNLLTAIWGNIALAKKTLDPENSAFQRLCQAELASCRAKEIIQNLLALSCCREPLKERLDITALLRETAAFALDGSNIECRFFILAESEQVEADPLQMKQIFHNLLSYAKETMPNGGIIELTTERLIINADHPIFNEGNVIRITVSSQGGGSSEVKNGTIFDFSCIASGRRHLEGASRGLAVSYAMARKHDGLLTVQSEASAGTELSIYLPASTVSELTKQELKAKSILKSPNAPCKPPPRPFRPS